MTLWDDPKTVRRFRRMSGAESAEFGAALIAAALDVTRSSLRSQHPRWSAKRCEAELRRLLQPRRHGL